jgi:DNA mismatch repair protein MutS
MSGKSTFLKSVGLCVYLAHIGISIPASNARIPFFDKIFIFINNNSDDILNGYSQFMNETVRLKEVLLKIIEGQKCFTIFDELFKGTNIEDAIQLYSSTIKGLSKLNGSFFLISTHLHTLRKIIEQNNYIIDTYCFNCKLEDGYPIFDYQIKEGWSDIRIGQILFKNEGITELLEKIYHKK